MSYRTCDLTHLAARVRTLPAGPTAVVAVSGFPAAGKTTLAGLLAERLGRVPVMQVDDLLGGLTAMAPDLPAGLIQAHEAVLAGRPGPVVLEGVHLLHPDLLHLADIHVWLDVDLNRANGNALSREAARCRRVGDPRPVGRLSSRPPPPRPDPPEQVFFDRHRPDRSADVLFVPVGRLVPPVEVRFMDELVDFVLWDEGNELLGELEDLLPMSEDLRARIKTWAHENHMLPVERPSDWGSDGRAFGSRGLALSVELQQDLGPEWTIRPVGLGGPE